MVPLKQSLLQCKCISDTFLPIKKSISQLIILNAIIL